MASCVTDLSREVGGLSHADAGPPKPVPLVATTVPDGGARERCLRLSSATTRSASQRWPGDEEVTFFSGANDGFFLFWSPNLIPQPSRRAMVHWPALQRNFDS